MTLWLTLWLALAQQVSPLNSVPPNPTVAWSQNAGTVEEVRGYIYRYYLDGAQNGAQLFSVTCGGTQSPWECHAPLPVTLGGTHTLALSAELTTGEKGPRSETTTFTIELIGAPTGLGPVIIIK